MTGGQWVEYWMSMIGFRSYIRDCGCWSREWFLKHSFAIYSSSLDGDGHSKQSCTRDRNQGHVRYSVADVHEWRLPSWCATEAWEPHDPSSTCTRRFLGLVPACVLQTPFPHSWVCSESSVLFAPSIWPVTFVSPSLIHIHTYVWMHMCVLIMSCTSYQSFLLFSLETHEILLLQVHVVTSSLWNSWPTLSKVQHPPRAALRVYLWSVNDELCINGVPVEKYFFPTKSSVSPRRAKQTYIHGLKRN